MDNNQMLDEFVRGYYAQLAEGVYNKPVPVSSNDTALVLIDVQKCIKKEYYMEVFKSNGIDVKPLIPVINQMEENTNNVLSNISKILDKCREKGIRPIHIKIEALLPDAADTGRLHKDAGMLYPKGSIGTEFCEEAAPLDDELVLKKTCSGCVTGTPIDRVMRNLGIDKVIVVGFYTDQCVSTSIRDFRDLGYEVLMVEDAMGAMSRERHNKALQSIKNIYANTETTESLLNRLDELE